MSRPSYDWPPEREAELIRRYLAGEKVKVIAWAIGLPDSAVDHHIARLQRAGTLPRRNRKWSEAEDIALLQALAQGSKPRLLARRFGRSALAVNARAVHLRRLQRQAQAEAQRAWASRRPGESAAKIAADPDQHILELRAA